MSETSSSLQAETAVASYGHLAGVSALLAAVAAVLVPNFGVLWITPLAMILGFIAIKGGERGKGFGVLVIVAVNMIITPAFWLNTAQGITLNGAELSQLVMYLDVFGVLAMVLMLVTGRLWTAAAAIVVGFVGIGIYDQINMPLLVPIDRTTAAGVTDSQSRGEEKAAGLGSGKTSSTVSHQICESPPQNAVTFYVDQDTYFGSVYAQEGAPNSPSLAFGGWGDYYKAFIQFDLALPREARSRANFGHVYLCLYVVGLPARDPGLRTAAIAADWAEDQVSSSRSPALDESDIVDFGRLREGWNVVEVTSFALSWLNGGRANHGLAFGATITDRTNGSFASAEAGDHLTWPRLVVTP